MPASNCPTNFHPALFPYYAGRLADFDSLPATCNPVAVKTGMSLLSWFSGKIRLAGCQINRHRNMFKHDQPVAPDLAIAVGDAHCPIGGPCLSVTQSSRENHFLSPEVLDDLDAIWDYIALMRAM